MARKAWGSTRDYETATCVWHDRVNIRHACPALLKGISGVDEIPSEHSYNPLRTWDHELTMLKSKRLTATFVLFFVSRTLATSQVCLLLFHFFFYFHASLFLSKKTRKAAVEMRVVKAVLLYLCLARWPHDPHYAHLRHQILAPTFRRRACFHYPKLRPTTLRVSAYY